jgi:hypothetical protein
MTTPEGRVKAKVREILKAYPGMYTYWPVPSGYGRTTVDVLGCYRGRMFAVEVKAPGKKPTLRQTAELNDVRRAMGKSFVVAAVDDPALDGLVAWLDMLTKTVVNDPDLARDTVNRRAL